MKSGFKRTIAIILSVVFIVAAVSCISVAAVSEIFYGDANGDGIINIRDVSYIQKVLAEDETENNEFSYVADVCQDMNINIMDVTTLQKYLADIYTQLPVDPEGWNNQIIKP